VNKRSFSPAALGAGLTFGLSLGHVCEIEAVQVPSRQQWLVLVARLEWTVVQLIAESVVQFDVRQFVVRQRVARFAVSLVAYSLVLCVA
jgi:hypothetical protein